ncbi:MAG: ATP synthase F0 subunit A [Bacteroidetes bacterium]|nr:MAG: ATP synthase F0 subunit A [Bacteroidota bacterium]
MSVPKLLIFILLIFGSSTAFAQHEEEKFDAAGTILHHILDTHDWHITDIPTGTDAEGHATYTPIALHLPWFFYSSRDGFTFASGTESLLEKGYVPYHEGLYPLKAGVSVAEHMDDHGHLEIHMEEEAFKEAYVDEAVTVIDLSLTKTSLQMILIGLLLLFVFRGVAKAYQRREGQAPKGFQGAMEVVIIFIRDEVARPYLGDKAMVFLPYLLTLFFFIWFANLFGLMPFNSNIAGNISVTSALAVLTFIIIQVNGTKDYWRHIFNTPGVPWWLKFGIPIMPIVEVIGIFTKPFALAVRLFANITAGHFMVLGLVSLIFIMSNAGENVAGGLGIMPISVLFSLVIFALEMIVAIVQPFIFTLLTAVFVGMAMESHDDHH